MTFSCERIVPPTAGVACVIYVYDFFLQIILPSRDLINMEQEIQKQRKKFELERELIPEVLEIVQNVEKAIAETGDDRLGHVDRIDQQRRVQRYLANVNDIRKGLAEKNFETKIRPFLEANKKILFSDETEKHSSATVSTKAVKRTRGTAVPMTHKPKRRRSEDNSAPISRREMLQEYMTLFHGSTSMPEIDTDEKCPLCDSSLIVVDVKAQATCTKCGYTCHHLDSTTASMQYNTDMEFSSFSYKRVNHFNDWMAQVQARETSEVGDDVLQIVMDELVRRRITSSAQITIPLVRDILKKKKMRGAYEHVTQIVCRLTGQPAPRLHPHLEECCRIMFIQIQPSFEKHKGKRKNMLSYSYTLFKFLQLLGVEDVPMLHFSLLKSKEKLEKQDEIFRKIAHDLDWEFIPSL